MIDDLLKEIEEEIARQNYKVVCQVVSTLSLRRNKKKLNRSQKHRRRLLEENPFCGYCGIGLDFDTSTIDHLIPRCRGGKWDRKNLVLCCESCNRKKADRWPTKKLRQRLKCFRNQNSE
jgi:5-methylcytosine-specific restriction endonuclease McrA